MGVAAHVITADDVCSRNATSISLPYPNRSAQKLKKMIARPNPISPPPVMLPSSVWVNPNWLPQSSRISTPRTENPIPAAISVKKLAQNRILSLRLGEEPPDVLLTYRSWGGCSGACDDLFRASVTAVAAPF